LFKDRSEVRRYAEEVPEGLTTEMLMEYTRRKRNIAVAGLAERSGEKLYNSAVVVMNGKFVYCYRKMHLFYKEKYWFDPGDKGFNVIDFKDFKLGIMICFDWIFPEAARTLALKGADILAHPSNLVLPGLGQAGMRLRAIENRVFCITANRVGFEEHNNERIRFTGRSQIVSPRGKIIANASKDEVAARSVDINPLMARNKNITALDNVLEGRRPAYYFI